MYVDGIEVKLTVEPLAVTVAIDSKDDGGATVPLTPLEAAESPLAFVAFK